MNIIAIPSVVLSVTSVHPTQRIELFANIFAHSNSLGAQAVYVKILEKRSNGF